MSNIVVPISAVIDAEARRIISELKAKVKSLEIDLCDASDRATSAERRLDRHEEEIVEFEKLKEVFKGPIEKLAEFLDIDTSDSSWF